MRHSIQTKRLGRSSSLRKATINSLARAVLIYQSVRTTHRKAKETAPLVNRLISLAKVGTLNARREAFRVLQDHDLVTKLFGEILELFKKRTSGYTRILRIGARRGDGAEMVIFELSDKAVKEKKIKKHKHEKEVKEKALSTENKGEAAVAQEKPKAHKKEEPVSHKEEEVRGADQEEKPKTAPKEEKRRAPEKLKEPPRNFLGGLRKFFKKERDSL